MASTFTLPDASAIRDAILRTERAGLIQRGVSNPNVTPGSDAFVRAQGVANQVEVAMANCQVKADAMMPDTASGDDLDRLLAIYGLTRRGASGAFGNIVLSSSIPTAVVAGAQLIDGSGQRFQVTVGGTYANGDLIPVAGIDTGSSTNHAAGDVLRWSQTQPAYANSTALVATGGLSGGVDQEDDETARQRLYGRLRNPPGAGNAAMLAELAEASSTLVQKAFVYPCANGPGNAAIAVAGYATSTSKSRQLPAVTVSNTVKPYVVGQVPEYADLIVTNTVDVTNDVCISLALPSSPLASPAGPGGGWTDGSPWPVPNATNSYGYCDVVNVTSVTVFQVRSETAPTANVTQIAWLSPSTWTVYTGTVTNVTTISTYVFEVTVSAPFTGIAVGCFISPNATNIQAYFTSVLTSFAGFGPGEKVTAAPVLQRAFRHPPPASAWPNRPDGVLLRALVESGSEVLEADYSYRQFGTSSPAVPGSVTTAPNLYVPKNISFCQKLT